MCMEDEIRRGTLLNGAWIKKVPSYYSPAQAVQFLECMNLDLGLGEEEIAKGTAPTSQEALTRIVERFLITFPWENTQMHYSAEHLMDVSPEGLFNRMVVEKKGGSYCIGLNGLLLGMLRALGYRAYCSIAKANYGPIGGPLDYVPPTHRIIFVQPQAHSNQTYLVDTGHGFGLSTPILLSNEEDNTVQSLNSFEKLRLTRTPHPSSSLESSPGSEASTEIKWNLEAYQKKKDSLGSDWRVLYSFSEEEFHEEDFEAASFLISKRPVLRGLFWHHVVCTKNFVVPEEERTLHSRASANGTVMHAAKRCIDSSWLVGK
ncbi:unnamed protein product [Cyclocybe aegerita]|uniref:Arylamine N-acetyltransferase n=1 Tax=Cyclocybe aegerita TaxID=1973307 RepID=A0A8S0WT13_CYCAE|nr:unnamed protein product [Cyclocybe aegerita]